MATAVTQPSYSLTAKRCLNITITSGTNAGPGVRLRWSERPNDGLPFQQAVVWSLLLFERQAYIEVGISISSSVLPIVQTA